MPLQPSGVPSRAAIQAAIDEAVNDAVAALNAKRQIGNGAIAGTSVDASGFASTTVTYPVAFPTTPKVSLTMTSAPGGSATIVLRAHAKTPTGFTVYAFNVGTAAATWTNLTFDWIAVVD